MSGVEYLKPSRLKAGDTVAVSACSNRPLRDRSEDHDAAASRIPPGRQCSHDFAGAEGQQVTDSASEHCHGSAICACVGDEEDEVTAGIVPQLVPEASLEGLAVGDPRLGLDTGAPSHRLSSGDLGVPRAQIAVDRERHLGSPAKRRMESRPESLQKSQLRPIPNRIAGRIGAESEIEPDHGTRSSEVGDRHAIEFPLVQVARAGCATTPDAAAASRRLRPAPIRANRWSLATLRTASRARRRPRSAGRSRVPMVDECLGPPSFTADCHA